MAAVIKALIHEYNALMELRDPRTQHLPLVSFWGFAAVFSTYVYFSTSLGPRLMRNRPAFELKKTLIIYNFVQIVLNAFLFLEICRIIWIPNKHSLICEEVDYSDDPLAVKVTLIVWAYYMVKILDCLDTVFMLLRKKFNQVSFLHVYHHAGMIFLGWTATNFVPGGASLFIETVNTFVHTVMYIYYFLTAIYPEYRKNIWWKRHITEIQMVQFLITLIHCAVHVFNPNCNFPKLLYSLYIPQDISMFFMFWDFYKKSYLSPKKEGKKLSDN